MINALLNFAIFQCGWLAAVYWHNNLAAVLVLLLAFVNLKLARTFTLRVPIVCILVATVGVANDYLLLKYGVISFPGQHYIIFPIWLAALWLLFVSTFSSSMAWLKNLRLITQAIIGGIGGSLSYIIGTKMGAMTYILPFVPQVLFHFVNWFVIFPIIYKIYFILQGKSKVS